MRGDGYEDEDTVLLFEAMGMLMTRLVREAKQR